MKTQSKAPAPLQTSQKSTSSTKKSSSPQNLPQSPLRIPLFSNNTSACMIEPQIQELLVMTIDLGNGKSDQLKVFEGDDPFKLAKAFVEKHNLEAKVIEPLAQNIYTNMEQVLEASVETLNNCDNASRKETLPKDIDLSGMTPELNPQKSPIGVHNLSNISHSPKYADDEEVYQMLNNTDEADSPLLAERVEIGRPQTFECAVRRSLNSPSEKIQVLKKSGTGYQKKVEGKQTKNTASGVKSNAKQGKMSPKKEREIEVKEANVKSSKGQAINRWPGSNGVSAQYKKEKAKLVKTEPAEVKREELISKSENNTVSNTPKDVNYGALLYHREIMKNKRTNKQIAEMRKQQLELNDKECTFTPEVNNMSQHLTSTKARIENVSELLIQAGKNKEFKIERARSALISKEMEECPFRPEINTTSQRIDQQKTQRSTGLEDDRCLKLYERSKGLKQKKEIAAKTLPDEYTFKPVTKEYNGSITQLTFEEREKKFKERLERINQLRELKEVNEVIDIETGEEYFKPRVGRAPKSGRNSDNLPVHDYLYSQHSKTKKQAVVNDKKVNSPAKSVKSSEKSQVMVENLMKRRLEDIFKKLDTDEDGFISSTKIDITQIDLNVLEALAPLLCDMENENLTLDFEKFVEQTERLLKGSTITARNKLILEKKGVIEPQYSFQPAIAKKSEKLAQKKRPYGHFDSLYESYTDERKKFELKIQEEKRKKAEDELKECTFKPIMYTKKSMSLKNSASFSSSYFMEDMVI